MNSKASNPANAEIVGSKILIIGIVASGKTTLAQNLAQQLGIPWYELDSIVHHLTPAGRSKRTPAEQMEVIREIDAKEHGYLKEPTGILIKVYMRSRTRLYSWILPYGSEKFGL